MLRTSLISTLKKKPTGWVSFRLTGQSTKQHHDAMVLTDSPCLRSKPKLTISRLLYKQLSVVTPLFSEIATELLANEHLFWMSTAVLFVWLWRTSDMEQKSNEPVYHLCRKNSYAISYEVILMVMDVCPYINKTAHVDKNGLSPETRNYLSRYRAYST